MQLPTGNEEEDARIILNQTPGVCVCTYVCVREREGERGREGKEGGGGG